MGNRKRFLFWEKCSVCHKWKVVKTYGGRWEYQIHDIWNYICNDCVERGELSKLTTK